MGQLTPNDKETATSPLQQNSQTQASEETTFSPLQQNSDSAVSTSSYATTNLTVLQQQHFQTPVASGSTIDAFTNYVTPETTKYKIKTGSMSDSRRVVEKMRKCRGC